MKYHAVCLLILCASLVSAERDFFDQGKKSNLFAPLSDAVRPILFKGVIDFGYDKVYETLHLDWMEKRNVLLSILHSSDRKDKYPINLHARGEIKERSSELVNSRFNYKLQNIIDYSTDFEKLFKSSLQFFENIHKAAKNFSLIEGDEKYLWLHYASIFKSYSGRPASDYEYRNLRFDVDDFKILHNITMANICNRKQSIQQTLIDYYGHILLAGSQLYINTYFAGGIDRKSYLPNAQLQDYFQTYFVKSLVDDLNKSLHEFNKYSQNFLNDVSSEIWTCDPKHHIEGVTYIKLDRPFKDYSKKEKDFNCDLMYTRACHNLSETTDRYFNIQPMYSDIGENKVITGIRFSKQNHITFIQIQEGELLANGTINEKSVSWKPLPNNTEQVSLVYDISSPKFKGIDLSETFVDKGVQKALIGISFEIFETKDGQQHLGLVTCVTPFNFNSGELSLDSANPSLQCQKPKVSRNQLKYRDDILPVDTIKENILYPNNDHYIKFNTIKSGKGAGETVPFIDIQPVETYPPSPMSGAGLYYKGNDESGGFLGLKLFNFNIVPFMAK